MGGDKYTCLLENKKTEEKKTENSQQKEKISLFEQLKNDGPQIKLELESHLCVTQKYISSENILKNIGNFLNGNIVVKSGMGTGKTKLIENVCEFYFKNKNILYLTNRITLSQNIS